METIKEITTTNNYNSIYQTEEGSKRKGQRSDLAKQQYMGERRPKKNEKSCMLNKDRLARCCSMINKSHRNGFQASLGISRNKQCLRALRISSACYDF